MSDIDPKKLKVAELREELKVRGLDTKGNKAQLVKRLEKALKSSANESVEDSSLDTSAIESGLDESQNESQEPEAEQAPSADSDEIMTVRFLEDDEPVRAPPQLSDEPEREPSPEPEKEPSPEPEPVKEASPEPEPVKEPEPEPVKEEPEVEEAEEAKEEEPEVKEEVKEEPEDTKEEPEATKEEPKEEPMAEETAENNGVKEESKGDEPMEDETADKEGEDKVKTEEEDKEADKTNDKEVSRKRHRSRSPEHHKSHTPSHKDRYHMDRRPQEVVMESDDWLQSTDVLVDRYNADLNLRINDNGLRCSPITVEGFAYMWAGARATYGVNKGKVAFEVKLKEHLDVEHLPAEETSRHVLRIGFSTDACSLQLGEEKNSFGYGGTGKASTECNFKDFGEKFAAEDTVTAYVDFESEPITLSFSKNGTDLGTCFEVEASTLEGAALFPHILSKNIEFEINFGQNETPFAELKEGYTFINALPVEDRVRGALPPVKKEDCEMIMMCGLPGCGKTTWASKHAAEHPEKRYTLLGSNNIIDKMKVMGLPRKKNYAGRWDVLIDKSMKCLTRLLEMASRKKRNYILDQTNVYAGAQRRKMRPFEGFQRKAVVIVPSDEDFKKRCEQREKEEGKDIPDSAVLEMKANFSLPVVKEPFDEVEFIELQEEEAKTLVETYNKDASALLPPPEKRFQGDRFRRDYRGGRDFRGGYNRDSRFGDNRRGGGGGGFRNDNRNRDNKQVGRYMGYSSADRQRAQRYDDKRDTRRQGSWGNQGNWGGNQGWGNQGWGNQGNWGNQGWGNQGNWNQGWGNYNQQSGNQNWGQNYNWSGYNQGNWGQGYNQQGQNWNQQNYGQGGYNYNNQSSSK